MEPEIAHRCEACGAAVRGAANVCPQCGQSLSADGHDDAAAPQAVVMTTQSARVEEAERVAASLGGGLAPRTNDESRETSIASRPISTQPATARLANDVTTASQPEQKVDEPAGSVRGRAAAVGASVGDNLRPRVERLRERSGNVLDEAADDPGLRFVLVAVALFVVALLLYVFSFVLR